MLKKLSVHGFRTLVNTSLALNPFTLMIGKNGVGKTTILDVLGIIGKFARGGPERAFGPPPWSIGWQRSKGFGQIPSLDFELEIETREGKGYRYKLRLNELKNNTIKVEEERLTRLNDNSMIAARDQRNQPASGTILNPGPGHEGSQNFGEVTAVSQLLQVFESYELNPSSIERGNEPRITFVGKDGYGVAGFLANLKDTAPDKFARLQERFQKFRPETAEIKVWSTADAFYWSLRDQNQFADFPAVHVSWGDRQILGMLCVLYGARPGATIAFEEIDRGFHTSRYNDVLDLLSEAAYQGLDGMPPIQVVATTHSPTFVNKLSDRQDEIRIVSRAAGGGTVVRPLSSVIREAIGTDKPEQPIGEIWEMGILEEAISKAIG